MFLDIQVPTAGKSKPKTNELGKILPQSRLNTAYNNYQLQNHANVYKEFNQKKNKFLTKILKRTTY